MQAGARVPKCRKTLFFRQTGNEASSRDPVSPKNDAKKPIPKRVSVNAPNREPKKASIAKEVAVPSAQQACKAKTNQDPKVKNARQPLRRKSTKQVASAKPAQKVQKRGQKMIASENRKKEKLEWEEYNKNWNKVHNPDNMPSESANNNNASGSESNDDGQSDIDLQDVVNMVDDEYKVSNLAFIEREKLNSEVRKKIKKEEEDSKKKYNSLAFRDVDGKLVKRELDLEKKKKEVENLNEEEDMEDEENS